MAEDTERRVRDDLLQLEEAGTGTGIVGREREREPDRASGSVSIGTSQSSGMVREVEGTNDLSLGAA